MVNENAGSRVPRPNFRDQQTGVIRFDCRPAAPASPDKDRETLAGPTISCGQICERRFKRTLVRCRKPSQTSEGPKRTKKTQYGESPRLGSAFVISHSRTGTVQLHASLTSRESPTTPATVRTATAARRAVAISFGGQNQLLFQPNGRPEGTQVPPNAESQQQRRGRARTVPFRPTFKYSLCHAREHMITGQMWND